MSNFVPKSMGVKLLLEVLNPVDLCLKLLMTCLTEHIKIRILYNNCSFQCNLILIHLLILNMWLIRSPIKYHVDIYNNNQKFMSSLGNCLVNLYTCGDLEQFVCRVFHKIA